MKARSRLWVSKTMRSHVLKFVIGSLLLVQTSDFLSGQVAQKNQPPNSSLNTELKQLKSLVSSLNANDKRAILGSYLSHDRKEIKVFVLESLQGVQLSPEESQRVTILAQSDADPVVKGYAQLLLADQKAIGVSGEAEIPAKKFKLGSPSGSVPPPTGFIPPVVPAGQETNAKTGFEGPNVENNNELRLPTGPYPNRNPNSNNLASPAPNLAPPIVNAPTNSRPSTSAGPLLIPQAPFWANPQAQTPAVSTDTELAKQEAQKSGPRIFDRGIDPDPNEYLEDQFQVDPLIDEIGGELLTYDRDAPLGFTGRSGVLPTEVQQSSHFVPIEDRWRQGFPDWDRYERGHPPEDDYPFMLGNILDPYNQNVLKGDYPILGQHTFLKITATNLMLAQYRKSPTPNTPFESTSNPFSEPFFGDPNQGFATNYMKLGIELFQGNGAFKPMDWRVKIEPVYNVNYLAVGELAVVNPDVRRGTTRLRHDFALQEWYVEAKIADLSADYDFASIKIGSQYFNSDFKGFLFKDVNRGARLFGTLNAARDQFNIVWFDQSEKDTNSQLNNFDDRHQNVTIVNYFREDFIWPGYTVTGSFHHNKDGPSRRFDDNDFLVRPDPVGVFQEHEVDSYYLGMGSFGHIGRINVVSQFYWALGNDDLNPIAGTEQSINAQMAALELSYDRDWIRFRTSYFFSSGDSDPYDSEATGFDTIFDDTPFAGEFSYWNRQAIKLFGANLVQEKSLVPDLRSSKLQGQSNFVNPGLHLVNFGMDFEIAPKLRAIFNANYLWFDETEVLEAYTFQDDIGAEIGADISLGFEYRPLLNDNVIFLFGSSILLPGTGLKDLYGTDVPASLQNLANQNGKNLPNDIPSFEAHFVEMILTY